MLTAYFCCFLLPFVVEGAKWYCTPPTGSPVLIDDSVADCVNGRVVKKATSRPPSPVTTAAATTTTTTTTPPQTFGKCQMNAEWKTSGHECCGYTIYHPGFQTCCTQGSLKAVVHDSMKERLHVCCGLKAYKRYDAPKACRRNPGNNDKLWGAGRLKKRAPDICKKNVSVFVVTVHRAENGLNYTGSVGQIYGMGRKTPESTREMPIPTDKYSPKKSIDGQIFLLISVDNHLNPLHLDLFLSKNDQVFKVPKRKEKRLSQIVERWFARCGRVRHAGRKRGGRKRLGRKRHSSQRNVL